MATEFEKICKAIKKDDTQKLGQFLQDSSIITMINQRQTKTGKTLIQIAMQNQSKQSFDMLLQFPGIDFQFSSNDGQFPLQTAILLNNIYFVTKLLEQHLNPRKKNAQGDTALYIAIKNQTSEQILKKLVHYNFNINQNIQIYGSYLNLAIVSNQISNFMFLLNQPMIKIQQRDHQGNTCLMLAVIHNKGDIVLAILQKIRNQGLSDIQKQFFINAQNKDGNTALHLSFLKNYQTISDIIQRQGIKLGLDLTIQNKRGMTVKQIQEQNKKDFILLQQAQKRKKEQKKIRQKQKQQQKSRIYKQQQRMKNQEKRKKKEVEKIAIQIEKEKKKETSQKTLFIIGIGFVLILGIMYLMIQSTIQKEKIAKGQF